MQFLIDESVGRAITDFLRAAGHDVLAVAEMTPRAVDSDILAWAANEKRILITNDKDFGKLVFRTGQAHTGVILFRLKDERATNQIFTLRAAMEQYADRLPNQFVIITDESVRIRGDMLLLLREDEEVP